MLGHPREIQEVHNAFATYEAMEDWDASVEEDLLAAHELLMRGLVDEMGERTQPDSSRSPTQRYRLTRKGLRWLQHHADE